MGISSKDKLKEINSNSMSIEYENLQTQNLSLQKILKKIIILK